MTRNKPRIFITLHPRGKNSLGENRKRLGHSAFHWGILISPKHTCHPMSSISTPKSSTHFHFDATDSIYVDPGSGETVLDTWRFRVRKSKDPVLDFQVLSRVFVGKLSSSFSMMDIKDGFDEIALPDRSRGENCVSWTREAVRVLISMGVLDKRFDLKNCMDISLGFADKCVAEQRDLGSVLDFTNRAGAFI
ncbi:uncharacterized protein BDV17DRAFT_252529 [Aspergillus undulatus]|uniref:uncharacterized protein n=1 Tax=Aspergillus undulatus TaxID=1810928 RepID=UPI003CCD59B5